MIESREPFYYEEDKNVPPFSAGSVFTVMDAQCSLCARGATWIARHDKAQEFKIIPLQSDLGGALMTHYGLDPSDPASWLYVEDGRAYSSLNAFIRVGKRLGGIWKVMGLLHVLPAVWQDGMYRFVARNRIRFLGTTDLCTLPDPEVRKRLLL